MTNLSNTIVKNFCAIYTIAFALVLAGCATAKMAKNSPSGAWNYTVMNTPDGNVTGTMTIQQEGEGYTGTLTSPAGTTELNNVTVEDQQLSSSFYYQGTPLRLSGSFSGDTFTGSVDGGGQSFSMEATRASSQ